MVENEISLELVATAQGFMEHGERIEFEAVERLDCCVVGSVAVGHGRARTGKGAGFADLQSGIFRALGIIDNGTPMATTVHSLQLVPDEAVVIETHDTPLVFIATELELIATGNTMARPPGVDWDKMRPDKFGSIPFLPQLREGMLAHPTGTRT